MLFGTENRNRTGTALRPLDFESNVSTNFTISANCPLEIVRCIIPVKYISLCIRDQQFYTLLYFIWTTALSSTSLKQCSELKKRSLQIATASSLTKYFLSHYASVHNRYLKDPWSQQFELYTRKGSFEFLI